MLQASRDYTVDRRMRRLKSYLQEQPKDCSEKMGGTIIDLAAIHQRGKYPSVRSNNISDSLLLGTLHGQGLQLVTLE